MKPKLLITGASGALARLVAEALSPRYELIGVDPRPSQHSFPGEFLVLDYNHRKMDEVFVQNKFSGLIHLGRTRESGGSATDRFQTNVVGTRKLLTHCAHYGIKNIIVLSTFHVYGAHRLNALYMKEDAALRASQSFPELADAVELDHSATTFLWQNRDYRTVVLRPVSIIGRHVRNTICTMLRSGVCPKVIGFDPLFQFIEERDMARAILLAFDGHPSGVYNVAGEGVIAYSDAIRIARAIPIPVPPIGAAAFSAILKKIKIEFPRYLLEYFRFPVIINDEAFRRDFGFAPKMKTAEALSQLGNPPQRPMLVESQSNDETV